jgi:hypothetical protein
MSNNKILFNFEQVKLLRNFMEKQLKEQQKKGIFLEIGQACMRSN